MQATSAPPAEGRRVAFGTFTFDRVSRLLRRDGVELPLPPRVLGVLELLLERPGEVVTKQALITAVWRDAFVTETSIAEAVSVLRQCLGDDPQRPTYVQTLHRRGYRFIAEVLEAEGEAPRPRASIAPAAGTIAAVDPAAGLDGEPQLSLLVPWLITLFALLTAGAAVWRVVDTTAPVVPAPVQFTVALPPGLHVEPGGAPVAISADGSTIAVAACGDGRCAIYLRPLSQPDATPVAGTAGGASPFFSADGRALGFFADGRLQTITLGGGAPATVASAPEALGATWLADGRIVFARSSSEGLFVAGPSGDALRPLTTPSAGEGGHRWPAALGDGSGVLFTAAADASRPAEAYGAVVSLATGSWARLLDGVGAVRTATADHLVAQRGEGLLASWFDGRTRTVVGLPVVVSTPRPVGRLAHYAVSHAGTLVTVAPAGDALQVVLHWSDQLRRLVPPPQPALPR